MPSWWPSLLLCMLCVLLAAPMLSLRATALAQQPPLRGGGDAATLPAHAAASTAAAHGAGAVAATGKRVRLEAGEVGGLYVGGRRLLHGCHRRRCDPACGPSCLGRLSLDSI